MSILTVWNNPTTNAVMLTQLSDDPADGTPDEQIAHLASLEFNAGFACVNTNYTGTVPEGDASYWRWDGSSIVRHE
jgi:hypothetical protein